MTEQLEQNLKHFGFLTVFAMQKPRPMANFTFSTQLLRVWLFKNKNSMVNERLNINSCYIQKVYN